MFGPKVLDEWGKWGKTKWQTGPFGKALLIFGIGVLLWYFIRPGQHEAEIAAKNAQITELDNRNKQLEHEVLSLKLDLSSAKTALQPFEEKAKQLFPNLDTATALTKLNTDLEQLKVLALAPIYKEINSETRKQIIEKLLVATNDRPDLLVFWVETSNRLEG